MHKNKSKPQKRVAAQSATTLFWFCVITYSTVYWYYKQWYDRGEQEVFEYELENGDRIKATKDHKFMAADGEMLASMRFFERGLDIAKIL